MKTNVIALGFALFLLAGVAVIGAAHEPKTYGLPAEPQNVREIRPLKQPEVGVLLVDVCTKGIVLPKEAYAAHDLQPVSCPAPPLAPEPILAEPALPKIDALVSAEVQYETKPILLGGPERSATCRLIIVVDVEWHYSSEKVVAGTHLVVEKISPWLIEQCVVLDPICWIEECFTSDPPCAFKPEGCPIVITDPPCAFDGSGCHKPTCAPCPTVITDPPCAFDGSGCATATPQPPTTTPSPSPTTTTPPPPPGVAFRLEAENRNSDIGYCGPDGEYVRTVFGGQTSNGASVEFPHTGCWAEYKFGAGPGYDRVHVRSSPPTGGASGLRECVVWDLYLDGSYLGSSRGQCGENGQGSFETLQVLNGGKPIEVPSGEHVLRVYQRIYQGPAYANAYLDFLELSSSEGGVVCPTYTTAATPSTPPPSTTGTPGVTTASTVPPTPTAAPGPCPPPPPPPPARFFAEGEARASDAGRCATDGESMRVAYGPDVSGGAALEFPESGCWAEWKYSFHQDADVLALRSLPPTGGGSGVRECAVWDLYLDGNYLGSTTSHCGQNGQGTAQKLAVLDGGNPILIPKGEHALRAYLRIVEGPRWANAYIDWIEAFDGDGGGPTPTVTGSPTTATPASSPTPTPTSPSPSTTSAT